MILTHYNLFISSTFKDMDIERDIIKYEVIPALNAIYNKKGVEIQAIDLRYGVNTTGMTEAEASEKVLNMCVNSIDRSRPFFIGFIGSRYGWIPPRKRWLDFYIHLNEDQRKILAHSEGLSVTELEIIYSGFFSNQVNDCQYLFCLRDDILEQQVSSAGPALFGSENATTLKKCQVLKHKIQKRCHEVDNASYLTYKLDIDANNILHAPALAQQLISRIKAMIDAELKASSPTPSNPPCWLSEINETRARLLRLALNSVGRPDSERLIEHLDTNILIAGPSFSGRSTLLARVFLKLFEEDSATSDGEPRKILLTAHVNNSQHSRNIHQIMGKWVIELNMLRNCEIDEDTKSALLEADSITHQAIESMFFEAVDEIINAGHSIHIFIDDLDQFLLSSPGDEKLAWVDNRVTVYATMNTNNLKWIDFTGFNGTIIAMQDVVEDPNHILLNSIKRQNFCELPDEICNQLAGDDKKFLLEHYEDNPDYICQHLEKTEYTFLQLNTIFKMVSLLNKDDFIKMRQSNKLENRQIMQMFETLPQDDNELLDYFVNFFTDRAGSKQKHMQLIQLLREHPTGLSVNDLIDEMDATLSAPEIYYMLYYFSDFISIEHDSEIVKLRHLPELGQSYILSQYVRREMEEIQKKADLFLIPDAMQICCNLINEQLPTDISQTLQLIAQYPSIFQTTSLTGFVINAYMLTLHIKQKDCLNACIRAAKSIQIAEQLGNSMDACRGHIYWATALMWKKVGNKKQARADGGKAIDIFESIHAVSTDMPELYMMIGFLWEDEGQHATAIHYYQRALKIMQFSEDYTKHDITLLSKHIETLK